MLRSHRHTIDPLGDCGPDYFVRVAGEWPTSYDANEVFSFTLHLRKRGRLLTPDQPLRLATDPVLAACARPLLNVLVDQAIGEGYSLRVDVARNVAATEPWPRWCLSSSQFAGLLETLVGTGKPRLDVYPVSIWMVPRQKAGSEGAVEVFRALPSDEGLFDQVMASGVLRLAVFDAFCDFVGPHSEGDRAVEWLKKASQAMPSSAVEWGINKVQQ